MPRHNAAELAHRLGRQAEAVCRQFLPNGRRQGNYWQVGDVQGHAGGNERRGAGRQVLHQHVAVGQQRVQDGGRTLVLEVQRQAFFVAVKSSILEKNFILGYFCIRSIEVSKILRLSFRSPL